MIAKTLPRIQREGTTSDLTWRLSCRAMALCSAGRLVETRADADASLQISIDIGPDTRHMRGWCTTRGRSRTATPPA